MSKNSIDAYGALGKTNVLLFDPDALVLVTEPGHPLYDERVTLPPNEAMVLNIMHQGVLQPIVITKDAELGATIVVAGRQRVKAAREANRRLREAGFEPVQVPAVVRRGESADLAGVMASENEIRKDDSPLVRARKMRRLLELGKSEEQVGVIFGCSVATVQSTVSLLDCTAAVRTAVDAGQIGVTHARKLATLPPDEQRAKVAEMVRAGSVATGRAKARMQRAVVETGPRMRTKREIEAELETASGDRRAALEWVLGR